MADKSGLPARTPARAPTTSKLASSSKGQQSILGFFSKATPGRANGLGSSPSANGLGSSPSTAAQGKGSSGYLVETTKANVAALSKRLSTAINPLPSSDAVEPLSSQENIAAKVLHASLPSPVTPAELVTKPVAGSNTVASSSPSRKVRIAFRRAPTFPCYAS